jgi:hypothetical protein
MHHQTIDIEMNDFTKYHTLSLPNIAFSPTSTIASNSQNEHPPILIKHCLYRSSNCNPPAILLFHTDSPISLGKEYQSITTPNMPIKAHEILSFQGRYIFTRSTFEQQETKFENILIIPYDFLQLTQWQKLKAHFYSLFYATPTLFEVSFLKEIEENGRRVLQKVTY